MATRVVQLNRRTRVILDEAGIVAKFGVAPESIPDYLALVGDSSDGYPGLRGWGPKSAAAVLARFRHLESIPDDPRTWGVNANNAGALALTLARDRDQAFLFRDLATLRTGIPLFTSIDALEWTETDRCLSAAGRAPRCRRARPGLGAGDSGLGAAVGPSGLGARARDWDAKQSSAPPNCHGDDRARLAPGYPCTDILGYNGPHC